MSSLVSLVYHLLVKKTTVIQYKTISAHYKWKVIDLESIVIDHFKFFIHCISCLDLSACFNL